MTGNAFHVSGTLSQTSQSIEFLGAAMLLQDEMLGVVSTFEGIVIEVPEQPRPVSLQNDEASSQRSPMKRRPPINNKERIVLDGMLADKTGPVLMTLWDDACTQFITCIRESDALKQRESNSNVPVVIRLENVRVVKLSETASWNGTAMTNIRVLQSVLPYPSRPGTEITLCDHPKSPYWLTAKYQAPVYPFCVTNFQIFEGKIRAPFRISIRGVVVDVLDSDFSLAGIPKRLFQLVDDGGRWIRCCALGRNALSKSLLEGFEIVIYFGTGRGPLNASPGLLYVMKDAMIVPIAKKELLRPKATEVVITDLC
jgi:hypothetical protein